MKVRGCGMREPSLTEKPMRKRTYNRKGMARRTWWQDQRTGGNEKLHGNISQIKNQGKDSHGIGLTFRQTYLQKIEYPYQNERARRMCWRGGRVMESMYLESQFFIE